MRFRLIFLLIFISGLIAEAQVLNNPFYIEPKFHTGMNLPLYKALDYLVEDNIYSFDISLSFPTYGDDFWEELYNYPRTGTGISLSSLGNKEVFGNAWSLYRFISIPFIRKDRISFNFQPSLGVAYIHKPFDIYANHLNRAIGSYVNIYIRLGADFRFSISRKSELILEGGFTHYSNGKTKSPNYGINIGSVSLGLNYLFNDKERTTTDQDIPEISGRIDQSFIAGAGVKVYDNLKNIKYMSTSLAYNAEYRLTNVSKTGIGADFIYDASIREALADDEGNPENDFLKQIKFGLHLSYSARYKRTVFGFQVGHYIYSKYPVSVHIYNRLTMQYLITENISTSIAVRSHMGKADCLEFGIGYIW